MKLDVRSLWARLCEQDPDSYVELEILVRKVCLPLLRREGAPTHDLEQLLQDILTAVWKFACKSDDAPRSLPSFLRFRARGALSDLRRARPPLDRITIDPISNGEEPIDIAIGKEFRSALRDCRDRLDPLRRDVWICRYERGISPEQTALEVNRQADHISKLLFQAKDQILRCLESKKYLRRQG